MYILYDELLYLAFLDVKQNIYPVKNYIFFPQFTCSKINTKELNIYI